MKVSSMEEDLKGNLMRRMRMEMLWLRSRISLANSTVETRCHIPGVGTNTSSANSLVLVIFFGEGMNETNKRFQVIVCFDENLIEIRNAST